MSECHNPKGPNPSTGLRAVLIRQPCGVGSAGPPRQMDLQIRLGSIPDPLKSLRSRQKRRGPHVEGIALLPPFRL